MTNDMREQRAIDMVRLRDRYDSQTWAHNWQHEIVPPSKPANELACEAIRALPTLFALADQQHASAGEDWVLVPREPSEAQWGGLARAIMMWLDMHPKTPRGLFTHLERTGEEIPQWLRDEPEMQSLDHVPSKGTRCAILYRAMLSAAPSAPSSAGNEPELSALFSAIRKSHAYSGGRDQDGEYVKLLFNNIEDRRAFLDAYVAGIAAEATISRRAALRRMVAMDEEIEAEHPGWMTGELTNEVAPKPSGVEERLREALSQWKCDACGGTGTYLNRGFTDDGFRSDRVKCTRCDGNGLHPTAAAALTPNQTDLSEKGGSDGK